MINYFNVQEAETAQFSITEDVVVFSNLKVETDYTIQLTIKLTVKKVTPHYSIVSWRCLHVDTQEEAISGYPFRKEFLTQNPGIEILYRIYNTGKFYKIENFAALYAAFDKTLDCIRKKSYLSPVDHDFIATKSSYKRRQLVEQIHIPDIRLLHFPFEISYRPMEKLKQDIIIPSEYYDKPLIGQEFIEHFKHCEQDKLEVKRLFNKINTEGFNLNSDEINCELEEFKTKHGLRSTNFAYSETYSLSKHTCRSWLNSIKLERMNKQENYYRRHKIEVHII